MDKTATAETDQAPIALCPSNRKVFQRTIFLKFLCGSGAGPFHVNTSAGPFFRMVMSDEVERGMVERGDPGHNQSNLRLCFSLMIGS